MTELGGRRILVLEDDFFLAADTCDWLRAEGAEVVGPAATAAHAASLIEREAIDAAILDLNLGRGPDYAIVRILAERNVPVLIATGYDLAAKPADIACAAWIEKPSTRVQMLNALKPLFLTQSRSTD